VPRRFNIPFIASYTSVECRHRIYNWMGAIFSFPLPDTTCHSSCLYGGKRGDNFNEKLHCNLPLAVGILSSYKLVFELFCLKIWLQKLSRSELRPCGSFVAFRGNVIPVYFSRYNPFIFKNFFVPFS
jgi:hypothetical protein